MESYYLDGPCVLQLGEGIDQSSRLNVYLALELASASTARHVANGWVTLQVDPSIGHQAEVAYGVSGGITTSGRFVVPDGAGHWCHFDPGELRVEAKLVTDVRICCAQFNPAVLLDWILLPIAQFSHAALGLVPLHASGAATSYDAPPFIFSAWSGVGKTNLVLHALARGGVYYGDDRVIVDALGRAWPSSRRVSIYGYNRRLASRLSTSRRNRLLVGDLMHRAARKVKGRPGFLLSYAANGVGSTRVSALDLGGVTGSTEAVGAHVLCESSATIGLGARPILERVRQFDSAGLAKAHAAVMEYEFIWFQRFIQTWRWSSGVDGDPWRDLMSAWDENLVQYFGNVASLLRLVLPTGSPTAVAPKAWEQLLGIDWNSD